MQTRSKVGIPKLHHILCLSHNLVLTVPTCYSTAIIDPKWKTAMAKEYNAQVANQTWNLIAPDPTKNLVGCK